MPVLYAHLLFYKHGTELQLLRSIELEQVSTFTKLKTAQALRDARRDATRPEKRTVGAALRRAIRRTERVSARTTRRITGAQQSSGALNELREISDAEAKIKRFRAEEDALREALPDYVRKLIAGYELRVYYFEVIECIRKLAIVCVPVFLPSGSSGQLIFGLMVCFLTFGTHMLYNPYSEDNDDRLAQLCQVQIFFALLSTIALRYDEGTIAEPDSMDAVLSVLTFLPLLSTIYLESPLQAMVTARMRRVSQGVRRVTRLLSVRPTTGTGACAIRPDGIEERHTSTAADASACS